MKKSSYLILSALSLVLVSIGAETKSACAQNQANTVAPGYGIGKVKLGMSKADVIKALPYHYGTYAHTFGVEELVFRYKSGSTGQDVYFDVLIKGGKAFQIVTSDQAFSASGGVNTGTPIDTIKAKYTNLIGENYYFSKTPGDLGTRFYDIGPIGLFFGVNNESAEANYMFGGMNFPKFIGVHWGNQDIVGIWEGTRGTTTPSPKPKPRLLNKVRFNAQQKRAAQAALKLVKRLEVAVSVGLTYSSYSERLVDTQIEVNEKLSVVPNSDFKKELTAAMDHYKSAAEGWRLAIKNADFELGANFMERTMQLDWSKASANIRNAENLIR